MLGRQEQKCSLFSTYKTEQMMQPVSPRKRSNSIGSRAMLLELQEKYLQDAAKKAELTSSPVPHLRVYLLLPVALVLCLYNVGGLLFEQTKQSPPTTRALHEKFAKTHQLRTKESIHTVPIAPSSSSSGDDEESSAVPLGVVEKVDKGEKVDKVEEAEAVVDIISVGSLLKSEYQDAQEATFAQNHHIRNFYRITERNDTDSECFTELTVDQMDHIINFCSKTHHQSYISQTLRQRLFEPKRHTGWMCAQKRPLDGLYQVLKQYTQKKHSIPDYVFIIDDDTYMQADYLLEDLVRYHPASDPYAVAGCNFDFLQEARIPFPYGGFGSFLTKATVQRLTRPFYCDGRDSYSHYACWRLNMNALGEKEFYRPGMSVIDLMHAYSSGLAFTEADKWTSAGYCLHSDHALAYFMNFYFVTVPEHLMHADDEVTDRVRRRFPGYIPLLSSGQHEDECKHMRDECRVNDRLCHYIKPDQMKDLYRQQQEGAAGVIGAKWVMKKV
jgi:hypothetical protein